MNEAGLKKQIYNIKKDAANKRLFNQNGGESEIRTHGTK